MLRFWMQALRAPFRNPIGQFVIALTDWAVLPLRRVIPGIAGLDLASLLAALALQDAPIRVGNTLPVRRSARSTVASGA